MMDPISHVKVTSETTLRDKSSNDLSSKSDSERIITEKKDKKNADEVDNTDKFSTYFEIHIDGSKIQRTPEKPEKEKMVVEEPENDKQSREREERSLKKLEENVDENMAEEIILNKMDNTKEDTESEITIERDKKKEYKKNADEADKTDKFSTYFEIHIDGSKIQRTPEKPKKEKMIPEDPENDKQLTEREEATLKKLEVNVDEKMTEEIILDKKENAKEDTEIKRRIERDKKREDVEATISDADSKHEVEDKVDDYSTELEAVAIKGSTGKGGKVESVEPRANEGRRPWKDDRKKTQFNIKKDETDAGNRKELRFVTTAEIKIGENKTKEIERRRRGKSESSNDLQSTTEEENESDVDNWRDPRFETTEQVKIEVKRVPDPKRKVEEIETTSGVQLPVKERIVDAADSETLQFSETENESQKSKGTLSALEEDKMISKVDEKNKASEDSKRSEHVNLKKKVSPSGFYKNTDKIVQNSTKRKFFLNSGENVKEEKPGETSRGEGQVLSEDSSEEKRRKKNVQIVSMMTSVKYDRSFDHRGGGMQEVKWNWRETEVASRRDLTDDTCSCNDEEDTFPKNYSCRCGLSEKKKNLPRQSTNRKYKRKSSMIDANRKSFHKFPENIAEKIFGEKCYIENDRIVGREDKREESDTEEITKEVKWLPIAGVNATPTYTSAPTETVENACHCEEIESPSWKRIRNRDISYHGDREANNGIVSLIYSAIRDPLSLFNNFLKTLAILQDTFTNLYLNTLKSRTRNVSLSRVSLNDRQGCNLKSKLQSVIKSPRQSRSTSKSKNWKQILLSPSNDTCHCCETITKKFLCISTDEEFRQIRKLRHSIIVDGNKNCMVIRGSNGGRSRELSRKGLMRAYKIRRSLIIRSRLKNSTDGNRKFSCPLVLLKASGESDEFSFAMKSFTDDGECEVLKDCEKLCSLCTLGNENRENVFKEFTSHYRKDDRSIGTQWADVFMETVETATEV